jgi:hypothetical protein
VFAIAWMFLGLLADYRRTLRRSTDPRTGRWVARLLQGVFWLSTAGVLASVSVSIALGTLGEVIALLVGTVLISLPIVFWYEALFEGSRRRPGGYERPQFEVSEQVKALVAALLMPLILFWMYSALARRYGLLPLA